MSLYLLKVLFTGFLVVLITEITKHSGKLGGILTAMPLTTLLVLFWLYFEKVPNSEISNYVRNTFYFVIPSLPFFIIFTNLLSKQGFIIAMLISILSVAVSVVIVNFLINYFNLN